MPLDILKLFVVIADAVEEMQYYGIYKAFRKNHKKC